MAESRIRVITSTGAVMMTSIETAISMICTGQYVPEGEDAIRFVEHAAAIVVSPAHDSPPPPPPERQGRPRRVRRPRALDPIRHVTERDFEYGDRILDILPALSQLGYNPGTRGVILASFSA